MKCSRCQHENRPGAKFCEECAAPLARTCVNCGAQLSATAKFCSECAHPAGPAAPPAPQRFGAPETYTPKHLAERIINSKAALEGERKQVTVLFADLKGSMELLADRDPEEARKILDPVLELMMEAVHRYEGTVNQVMGDGIMALFGAPLAHEDHAVRACYAALRMQESVKRYAEGVFRRDGIPVEIRVGLNSGGVVVRAIGSDLHMDYTAVGQTTHLAARMEQMARPGTILLAPETLALAEGFVEVTSRGPVPVKGLAAPIEIFELVGASRVRSRLHAAAARGLTRFVGRDAELELLRQALGQAGEGHGQVVAIVGEPGVGKSRLVWEFNHSQLSQGWRVLEAPSVSYGKATTYYPVIELLRRYFQIEPQDDDRRLREKVTGKLFALDRALEPALPALLSLLDVPADDAEWEKLDPPQRRKCTIDALKKLLVRESHVQPVLLVFDDLHWSDNETQALLDALIESVPTTRMLLLVNYRPEYTHGWGSKTYYQQIRLDTLPTPYAGELLETLLGSDPALVPLQRLLIQRTLGNPFLLEETVRALVETGMLTGESGSYQLAGTIHGLQVPATVQSILTARIDRLAPEDKRVLQAAGVIGKDFSFALLQAVVEESEGTLQQRLLRLQAAEFLYEAQLFPDLEYTFKHALTHEVAYGSLLQAHRHQLHAKVVAASEQLYADRLDEQVERLAYHSVRGQMWEQAASYLQRAGGRAFARSANREAAAYYEEAVSALARVPESRETMERAIALRFDERNAMQLLGQIAKAIELLREAERIAHSLDDRRRLAMAWAYLSNSVWMEGRSDEARVLGRDAVSAATALDDPELIVAANVYLGGACLTCGDLQGAIACHREVVRRLEGQAGRQRFALMTGFPEPIARTGIAMALAECGRFVDALTEGEEAVRVAESLDHPHTLVWACWGLATVHLARGEVAATVRLVDRAFAVARERDLSLWFAYLNWYLGRACTLSGRVTEGVALLQESLRIYAERKSGTWEALAIAHLGEAQSLAGRGEEAQVSVNRAVMLSRQRGERSHEAHALLGLGRIMSQCAQGEVASAEDCFRGALSLATELGMRPLVAHCHLGLGKLYRRTDKREQAQEHLATATTMYREMDMRFWLEKAEVEVRGLA
jgi:class 3 adenylate cyclase/tetratricopeptide (TPR) repeat protein